MLRRMIAIPAKMQPSREKGAQMAGYLRWSGVLLVMLQFAVAGAAGARAQETNQMVQSVVQNVRDSVQYRMTNPLRGRLTKASAAVALRDSVAPGNTYQRASLEQWHYSSKGQGLFKRLD